jgi:hypothetical protein
MYGIDRTGLKDTRWICIQHGIDYFTTEQRDALNCDLLCILSRFWWSHFVDSCHSLSVFDSWKDSLPSNVVETGFPQFDVVRHITGEEVRRKYNIPRDKKVFLYIPPDLPYFYHIKSFWKRLWFSKLFYPLKEPLKDKAMSILDGINPGTLKSIRTTEYSILKSVSEFCRRNDLFLIIKSRVKHPVQEILKELADAVFYDETFYPSTITELLYISDISLNFMSMTTYESVFLRSYSISVQPEVVSEEITEHSRMFWGRDWLDFFVAENVAEIIPGTGFAESFSKRDITDFTIDEGARKRYVERFFTYDDAFSSRRVIDAMENLFG